MAGGAVDIQQHIQSFVDSGYGIDVPPQDNSRFSSTDVDDQQSVSIESMDPVFLSVPSVSDGGSSDDEMLLDSGAVGYDDTSVFHRIAGPSNQAEGVNNHLSSEIDAHSSRENSLNASNNGED